LINTLGYWNGLLDFLDTAVDAGFLKPANRTLLRVVSTSAEAITIAIAAE
jgi:predicted Rossmann-fold nucleotide-binding protein